MWSICSLQHFWPLPQNKPKLLPHFLFLMSMLAYFQQQQCTAATHHSYILGRLLWGPENTLGAVSFPFLREDWWSGQKFTTLSAPSMLLWDKVKLISFACKQVVLLTFHSSENFCFLWDVSWVSNFNFAKEGFTKIQNPNLKSLKRGLLISTICLIRATFNGLGQLYVNKIDGYAALLWNTPRKLPIYHVGFWRLTCER